MEQLTVECQVREDGTKPGALRRSGVIPAALYGHSGAESVLLTLDAKIAATLCRKARVRQTPIQLTVPALPWAGTVVLHEVQAHPARNTLYHLSFFALPDKEALVAS